MTVSNSLVYGERLQCGSDKVALGRLQLPFYPFGHAQSGGWMDRVLHPDSPVLFLDTDGCPEAVETGVGGQICNRFEAKLVTSLILKLRMVIGSVLAMQ